MGSDSDLEVMQETAKILDKQQQVYQAEKALTGVKNHEVQDVKIGDSYRGSGYWGCYFLYREKSYRE